MARLRESGAGASPPAGRAALARPSPGGRGAPSSPVADRTADALQSARRVLEHLSIGQPQDEDAGAAQPAIARAIVRGVKRCRVMAAVDLDRQRDFVGQEVDEEGTHRDLTAK